MIINTNRNFGLINHINPNYLSYIILSFTIVNTIFRFIWGMLYDFFGFKIPFITCLTFEVYFYLYLFRLFQVDLFICLLKNFILI